MGRDGAIWVLKAGEALEPVRAVRGDFELWIAHGLGFEVEAIEVTSPFVGEALPDPARVGGVVVTGSPAMVSDREAWSEASGRWLAEIVEGDRAPVLGICFGHQLIAQALGGEVARNPRGREMGTVEVTLEAAALDADPLLRPGRIPAHMSHLESVLRPPPDAVVVASTALEPHAAMRFGPRQWGVQFHPEFDRDIMQRYVEARREALVEEGFEPNAIARRARDTPESAAVLRRFASIVSGD
jgi:GMP synthase (glutamine-hydrolysing)